MEGFKVMSSSLLTSLDLIFNRIHHLPSFLTSNAYAGDTTLSWVVYSAKSLYGYVLTIFQFGDFVGGFPWLIAI